MMSAMMMMILSLSAAYLVAVVGLQAPAHARVLLDDENNDVKTSSSPLMWEIADSAIVNENNEKLSCRGAHIGRIAGAVICVKGETFDNNVPVPKYCVKSGWHWPNMTTTTSSPTTYYHSDFSILHDPAFENVPGVAELRKIAQQKEFKGDGVPTRTEVMSFNAKQTVICPGCDEYVAAVEATADLNPWKSIQKSYDDANDSFCSPIRELPFYQWYLGALNC